MKKLKAILIDDEQGSLDALIWELENFSEAIEVIGKTTDPNAGISMIQELNPDLLFLDIQMPEMTGFELLEKIKGLDFKVIFTTAYDQFALKAFEAKAYDYLLKPVAEEELARALEKVKSSVEQDEIQTQLQSLIGKLEQGVRSKNLALPTSEGLEFIPTSSIIRCSSDSNYTNIYVDGEKPLLVSKTLKEIEQMIDSDHFFRIHHSHLINLNYLKKYLKGKAGSVILKDGTQLPVSRSRKGGFLDEL